jgi:hypothetical protein
MLSVVSVVSMMGRHHPCAAAILVALAGTLLSASRQKPPDLDAVLRAAAGYVEAYEPQLSGVVSEELYRQASRNARGQTRATRLLRSDTLLIRTAAQGWFGFRDVFEVDGKPVRDRDERLSKLFLNPSASALEQAKQIADESARFNLGTQDGTLIRTINLPTIALAFLRREIQNRSAFKADGLKAVDGVHIAQVRFEERATPRMIRTLDEAAVRGRFWIDPGSGRVVRTELDFDSAGSSALIRVSYAPQPNVAVWVPVSMEESYRLPGGLTIEGRASYSNFRKFNVSVDTVIK